jgi:hypothetical protein
MWDGGVAAAMVTCPASDIIVTFNSFATVNCGSRFSDDQLHLLAELL